MVPGPAALPSPREALWYVQSGAAVRPAGGALVPLGVKKTKSVFSEANSVALKLLRVGFFFVLNLW